jgi:phospho-2-dehydro-3-deoxyheptonate aldolase
MKTDNLKIETEQEMITPKELKEKYPAKDVAEHINNARKIISDIVQQKDDRLLVIS